MGRRRRSIGPLVCETRGGPSLLEHGRLTCNTQPKGQKKGRPMQFLRLVGYGIHPGQNFFLKNAKTRFSRTANFAISFREIFVEFQSDGSITDRNCSPGNKGGLFWDLPPAERGRGRGREREGGHKEQINGGGGGEEERSVNQIGLPPPSPFKRLLRPHTCAEGF